MALTKRTATDLAVAALLAGPWLGGCSSDDGPKLATEACRSQSDCDDGLRCTDDFCTNVGCVHTQIAACAGEIAQEAAHGGADSGVDSPEPRTLSFDRLAALGMCPTTDAFDRFDLSLQLQAYDAAGLTGLLPTDRLRGDSTRVEQALGLEDFAFTLPGDGAVSEGYDGYFRPAGGGSATGTSLSPRDLRFDWVGGEARAGDERLVVLLVDHSGSLRGQPDPALPLESDQASDRDDVHLSFLKALVRSPALPASTYFSLVWFEGSQPVIRPFARPTRTRDVLVCPDGAAGADCREDDELGGLDQLERDEQGGTPLIDALGQTYDYVIADDQVRDLNPVVVLFTDGVESGDTSRSGTSFDEILARYAAHRHGGAAAPVPVVVLHLQAGRNSGFPRGRSEDLYRLACATGGEYLYLDEPGQFGDPNLAAEVANRLFGTWRLTVSAPEAATLSSAAGYLLSTELGVGLGGERRAVSLKQTDDGDRRDPRPWVVPPESFWREPDAPQVTATWSDDDRVLTLAIAEGAPEGPYRFGIAETGNGANGWNQEDCLDGRLCRDVPASGVLPLVSVHPSVGGAGLDAIDETHTLLYGGLEAGLTYVLIRDADDWGCWAWGHNPTHYGDLGCAPLPGD